MAENGGTIKIGEREKPFGIVAIEKGYITPDEFVDALRVQISEDIEHKKHRLIGEILLAQGKISEEQIEDVLRTLSQDKP